MNPSDLLTVVEGYDAVRVFLNIVGRRRGTTRGEIASIVGALKWARARRFLDGRQRRRFAPARLRGRDQTAGLSTWESGAYSTRNSC
jgi:hypothetical protein